MTTPVLDRFFVYDGWNLLMELDAQDNNEPVTEYTWGLDLSGQNGNPGVSGLHGAGGIGGLLAALDVRATVKNTQSLALNGKDQYVVVPHAPALSFGGADFTIEAYVKLDASSQQNPPAQFLAFKKRLNQPDPYTDYGFMVQAGTYGPTGQELALMLGDGVSNTQTVVSSLRITDSSWHYVSVAYDVSTRAVRFILDGATDPRTALQQSYCANTGDVVIGAYHSPFGQFTHYLCGWVDEVRISRGVVATDELLKADPPRWPTTAVVEGYWRFEDKTTTVVEGYWRFENKTTTIADVSGNGLDGTAVGKLGYSTDVVLDTARWTTCTTSASTR